MVEKETADSSQEGEHTTKVGRLIAEYELGGDYGAELESRWTATGDERMSLRALADLFNKRLLETTMADANMSTLDGEVENLYRLLTSEDVSRGKYTEARNRLEQRGIDVDQLEQDLVTYQAIRSYLQNERDAEYNERSDDERLTSAIESIQRLKSRMQSVSESTLTQLRNASIISLGDFRVFVNVSVHCEDCGTQLGVVELLQRGGCDCQES